MAVESESHAWFNLEYILSSTGYVHYSHLVEILLTSGRTVLGRRRDAIAFQQLQGTGNRVTTRNSFMAHGWGVQRRRNRPRQNNGNKA